MSGILKKIKNRKKLLFFILGALCCCIIFITILASIYGIPVEIYLQCVMGTVFLSIIYLFLNYMVYCRIVEPIKFFGAQSQIRNVDFLIIGDMYKPEELNLPGKTGVHIYAPNRSFSASYEILRHTFSILKEGGTAVIAVKKNKLYSKTFSIWDIPFLHRITIEKYNLKRTKKYLIFPLVFHPLLSIQMFMKLSGNYKKCDCPMEEVEEFCRNRSINLICRVKE